MNKYKEMSDRHMAEFGQFPCHFAFNDEQVREALEKLGATVGEVWRTPEGGIIRRSDAKAYAQMKIRWNSEHQEALKDEQYVYEMFRHELANHEYAYTRVLTDTLETCGVTLEMLEQNPMLQKALDKAVAECLAEDE